MKLVAATLFAAATATAAFAEVPGWVTAAAAIPTPEYAKSARAVVLLDSTSVSLAGGGVLERHRRAVRILGARAHDVARPSVVYDADTPLSGFRGWSVAADGTVTDIRQRDARESTPWGELYNDAHIKTLEFPSTDPGTVVVCEYEQRNRPDFLQTTWEFQDDLPVVMAELELALPPTLTYDAHWFHHDEVKAEPGPVWRLRDVPAIEREPHMPAAASVAGRLGIRFLPSNAGAVDDRQTWPGIARWYSSLADGRCAATPALQAKARELAPASAPPLDRIRALAAFAQRDVRYVAIEIGIGGYQPHPAGDIFSKRYGDCKDKVTLLRTMLREAGIESYYIIVNATRGIVDPAFPSLRAFNHAIIAIRLPATASDLYTTIDHPKLGRLLIFDPTSTETPFGLLPSSEEGGHALLVTGDGGELITLPVSPPRANQLRRMAKLQLDETGTLRGEVEEIRTGDLAADLRYDLRGKNQAERVAWVESGVAAHLTKSEVSSLSFEHIDDNGGDVVIRYKLVAHDYAAHAAELTLVRPRLLGQKADPQIDVTRKHPYITGGQTLHVDDVEITIPVSLRLDELPPPAHVAIAPLTYTSEAKFDGTKLTYHREYTMKTSSITASQFADVNRAFAKIASDERATAVFVSK